MYILKNTFKIKINAFILKLIAVVYKKVYELKCLFNLNENVYM